MSALFFLSACGGGSNNAATAPPSGGFSTSSLSGSYVFSFSGTDISSSNLAASASFFAVAGVLTASSGNLSGTIDVNDPELEAALGLPIQPLVGQALTGGAYKITADGRGNGTIQISVSGTTVQLGIDFVLTSSSHGLITRFDNNGTGSGTLDLQSSVAQSALTSYAFSLSGVDSNLNAFGSVGSFALGGTTTISTGFQDFNDDLNSTGLTDIPLTGSVSLGAAGAAGTAQLTATGSPYGLLAFDVWPIDATHMKLIETDSVEILAGDAFTQQTSISSGPLVYTMTGLDVANSDSLLAVGGFMSYDGTSAISGGYEDINDGGSIGSSATVSGTLTATGSGTGRYELVLNGFFNSVAGASTYTFAAYPTSGGGILLLEIDDAGVTGGTAFSQTAQTFAASEGYGLNLTGANSDGEVDDIAEFTANSGGALSDGLIDENDQGSVAFDQKLGSGGTYTFDSGNTGRGEISYPSTDTTLNGFLNLDFYVANSSTILFIDADSGAQTGVGEFESQGSNSPSSALAHTQSHAAALKAVSIARARRRKQ
jgi:hypothetical protein